MEIQQTECYAIDLLRCVLMVFIVTIHTNLVVDLHLDNTSYGQAYAYLSELLWLSNSLFFTISGYLYFKGSTFNLDTYIDKTKRRIHSLVLPYFLWNTIIWGLYSVGACFVPSLSNDIIKPIGSANLVDVFHVYFATYGEGLASMPINGPFWFLRNLIFLSLLTPLFYLLFRGHRFTFLVLPLVCFIPMPSAPLASIIFFGLGCYVGIWSVDVMKLTSKVRYALVIYLFTLALPYLFTIPEQYAMLLGFFKHCAAFVIALWLAEHYLAAKRYIPNTLFHKSLFFIFAFHGFVARFLTKSSALLITKHPEIPPALLHFVNVVLSILVCILLYKTLQKLSPKLCKVLGSRA